MRRLAVLATFLLLPVAASAQTTVYSNTFESAPLGPEWTGPGIIETTGGLSAFGFGALHLRNSTPGASLLSLSGLAPHSSMTLLFHFAMWDSIDFGDTFIVSVDGNFLFNGSFGNYFAPSNQCEGPGTVLTPPFIDFGNPNYGYNTGFRDCARTVAFTFGHTGATAQFSFAYPNTQGGLDESFGLDNIIVRTNSVVIPPNVVPEPSTYAMMGLGLFGVFAALRRRSRQ